MISSFGQVIHFIHRAREKLAGGRNGGLKLLKFKSLRPLIDGSIPPKQLLQLLTAFVFLFGWTIPAEAAVYYLNSYNDAVAACSNEAKLWNDPSNPAYPVHVYACVGQWSPGPPRVKGITTCCGGWETTRDAFFYPASQCPSGTDYVAPGVCQNITDDKMLGAMKPEQCVANPCDPATGNKYHSEDDSSHGTPIYTRYYNSQLAKSISLGNNWTSSFHRRLEVIYPRTKLITRRADGKGLIFTKDASGQWKGETDNDSTLAENSFGYVVYDYTLTMPDGTREKYDASGKIVSETDSTGRVTSYGYDTSNRLTTVTNSFGHKLTFGYDTNGRLWTVTDPNSKMMEYLYDANNNNLTRVDYPDGTAKLYHYNEPGLTSGANLPNHLTGISYVSAGVTTRYSTYTYDTTGKAIHTEHADVGNGGAQERFLLNYDSDTQTTVTDPVAMQEVMTFSTNLGVKNLVSKVNQSDGKSVQQVFDTNNNLTCKKDEENRVTLYSYNSTNQKTSMTEGMTGDCANPVSVPGVTRSIGYQYLSSTLDLPTLITSPSVYAGQSKTTVVQYTDTTHPNLPTVITQAGFTPAGASVSRTVSLGYNTYGQVNSINGPRTDVSDVTTLEYNECTTGGGCGQLQRVTNALGHITTYDSYDANGRLLRMTEPSGLRVAYTYDPRGRVTSVTRAPVSAPDTLCATPGNACWQYSYTPWGDVSQVTDPDGVALTYQYDAAHYLRYIVDGAGNYLHYQYDLKGNRTGEDTHDLSGVLTRTVGYAYDLRNHLSQINLAGDITQVVHDAVGNLTSETDPNNHDTTHHYDVLNRLFKTVNALSQETVYGQDANDRPTTVTAPNNLTTQYQYDDLGNLLRETSPDRGTTVYTHDAAGNVLTVKDARNITTTYTFDALNRVSLQQSSQAGTPSYGYAYDACGKGRLCSIQQNGQFHLNFGYDGLGRENYRLNTTGAAWVYYSAVYSPGGRLTSLVYPTGRRVDYQYDTLGRVSQVSTTAGGTTDLAKYFIHQPFGPVQSFLFGNNRNYWTSFDQAYRPVFLFSGPLFKLHDYDPAGNLKSRTDISNTAQTFDYSPLNELTTASDTQAGSYGNLAYSYLANGNRESETRNGVSTPYYYYDNTNRLYHAGNSDWRLMDQAGNTIWSNALWGVSYDGYGRLLSSSKAQSSYGYNALNQRTKKTAGGVTTSFLYGPNGELLYETDGTNNKAYIYLNDMPLARADNNSQIYYYHTDHLGTPQQMTNSAGATVWKALYEPFGWAVVTNQTIQNNVRLAGQYYDAETGLHYNNARYYDPKVGRYITSDPIGLAGGLNTYTYAYNNPLRYTDPTGLFVPVGPAVITVVEGIINTIGGLVVWNAANNIASGPQAPASPDQIQSPESPSTDKKTDREKYHRTCDQPPPPGLTGCDLLRWKLNKARQCKKEREDFANKYYNGSYDTGHATQMQQLDNQIRNLEKALLCCKD